MKVTIGCMEKPTWWLVHSYVFISIAFTMILAMTLQTWQFIHSNSEGIDVHGGLLRFEEQEALINNYDCDNYNDCSSADGFNSDQQDVFSNYHTGGLTYIVTTSLSVVALTSCVVILVLDVAEKFSKTILTVVLIWVAFLLNAVGFIVWAVNVKVTFGGQDNCESDSYVDKDGDQVNACAGPAGVLGLVIAVVTFFTCLLHTLLWFETNRAASQVQVP